MSLLRSQLYFGSILHRRYFPKRHQLRYNVGNLFINVDEFEALSQRSWAFGYNRKALFSVHDRHYGDGTSIAQKARESMAKLSPTRAVYNIYMFCYPAVLGKVFNPLTVYFGFDAQNKIAAVIYEVSNTFGQRHSYAMAVENGAEHCADKEFYVSPFNPSEGSYRFSFEFAENHLRLNIALFEGSKLKLCARFEGKPFPISDAAFARSILSLCWQPIKVMFGIHYHALKLYLKGLKLTTRPDHPKYAITFRKVKP